MITSQALHYSHGTVRFHGQLYWDESLSGPRPGVVVFPEAFGLNEHARVRAERLAGLGFVALAADPHGEGAVFSDMESLSPSIQSYYADRTDWRARARAALDALMAQPQVDSERLAAIGFCFGGATCLELARSGAPLSAVVTFHAGLLPELEGDAGAIKGKVLICHGAEDPLVTEDVVKAVTDELRRDKVDWQLTYYGGAVHSFTDPVADSHGMPALAYHQPSEIRSWAAMRHLLTEAFAH